MSEWRNAKVISQNGILHGLSLISQFNVNSRVNIIKHCAKKLEDAKSPWRVLLLEQSLNISRNNMKDTTLKTDT